MASYATLCEPTMMPQYVVLKTQGQIGGTGAKDDQLKLIRNSR